MSSLFEPISLRELTLANRIIVSPMCQYSAVEGCAQPWHGAHLSQFALSNTGMIVLEATAVDAVGRITPGCLGLYDDATEAALSGLLTHLRNPALNPMQPPVLALQLGHAGRKASSHVPWDGGQQIPLESGGWPTVSASPLPHLEEELPPAELSTADLAGLTQRFVTAVERAERLGIDALEMHAAHGYLLHQFLSPVANQRDDDFGGSLENRMRYPLAVFAAMRAAWPAQKPLGVRLSATDWDETSSWGIDEACEFARRCEALGCDWIDVSSGGVSRRQKIALEPGYQVPFAAAIKRAVSIPVMAVGLITEPQQAEDIISSGQADMVALARAFLYNPRWAWHAAAALGTTLSPPPQYWRCAPASAGRVFGNTRTGQR